MFKKLALWLSVLAVGLISGLVVASPAEAHPRAIPRSDCYEREFVRGDRHPCVWRIQRIGNQLLGGRDIHEDGIYGLQTAGMVWAVQYLEGIRPITGTTTDGFWHRFCRPQKIHISNPSHYYYHQPEACPGG